MALNIKNEVAERLAKEVAKVTGETKTQAVIRALEERLLRLRGARTAPDLVESILEISRRSAALPDLDERTPDEILGYDQAGTFERS
jgi:antitoxin VapB